jgi:hypothetical protein
MGFLDGLGRIMQGKPVFEFQNQASNKSQNSNQLSEASQNGPKTIPVVRVERVELHTDGSHMRVIAAIQNDSAGMVMLDKIRLLGTHKELDRELRPGESREFTVFDGQRPNNRNYDDAELYFRDTNGDYFLAKHVVIFRQESDNTYSVYDIRFTGPVKDV